VAVLFNAGDQLPVIFFPVVVGRVDNPAPEQIGPTGVKDGVTTGLTVTVRFVVDAHCPAAGVNV
jgi:hypothetical protein